MPDGGGLVAVGGSLEASALVQAYRRGIFPWSENPVTWWCPDPRAVIEPGRLHVPRSLERLLRQERFGFTLDRCFRGVIEGCVRGTDPSQDWITPGFVSAYCRLHAMGHAHSIEVWRRGELAGGLYGVALGGLFTGESMFHRASNASKAALAVLHRTLFAAGFLLFDIQMLTSVTRRMGGTEIPRSRFLERLEQAVEEPCSFPRDPLPWRTATSPSPRKALAGP